MGIQINIWEMTKVCRHLVHTLQGGRGNKGGYDALNHMVIIHGDAGHLGNYPILSLHLTSLPAFYTNSTILDFKDWTCHLCHMTEVTLTSIDFFQLHR